MFLRPDHTFSLWAVSLFKDSLASFPSVPSLICSLASKHQTSYSVLCRQQRNCNTHTRTHTYLHTKITSCLDKQACLFAPCTFHEPLPDLCRKTLALPCTGAPPAFILHERAGIDKAQAPELFFCSFWLHRDPYRYHGTALLQLAEYHCGFLPVLEATCNVERSRRLVSISHPPLHLISRLSAFQDVVTL